MNSNKGKTYYGDKNRKGSSHRKTEGMTKPVDSPKDDSNSIPLVKIFDGSCSEISEKLAREYFNKSDLAILVEECSLFTIFLSYNLLAPVIVLEDNKEFSDRICKSGKNEIIIEEYFYKKYFSHSSCNIDFYPFDFLSLGKDDEDDEKLMYRDFKKLLNTYFIDMWPEKTNKSISELHQEFLYLLDKK